MDSQGSSGTSQDSTMTIVDENRHEILYFAYGSNLSTEQMRQRCPHSTPVGLGFLKGWKWIIYERGYANIVQLPQRTDDSLGSGGGGARDGGEEARGTWERDGVYGLLYLLPPDDESRLDRYEGVPVAYEKLKLEAEYVIDGEGRKLAEGGEDGEEDIAKVTVLAYVNLDMVKDGLPKEEYVPRMERGIKDAVENWGMSEEYADKVMRKYWR